MLLFRLGVFLAGVSSIFGAEWIVPGAVWTDTDGNKIDAHGGGVFKQGNAFYWIGYAATNQNPMLYTSTDLLNWKNLGAQSTITGLWRPKIATPNNQFWIFGQQDRYVRSLVSPTLVGRYVTSAKVHLPPNDYTYSDTGMYYDEDSSTWYLLTSADHNTVQINKINADGTVGQRVLAFSQGPYEAPGIFKDNGTYYLILSGKTGYRSNPNKVFSASSLSGPWSGGTDIAPPRENTYNSQNTFELTIRGSQKTTHIYMGDAWDSRGGANSNYVWLPIQVDSRTKRATLEYHAMWKVDVETGIVSYPTPRRHYKAQDASVREVPGLTYPGDRSTKRSMQKVSSDLEAVFYNVTGTGAPQWFSIQYTVNDPEAGEAHIFVNNDPTPTNISAMNCRAGYAEHVPVRLLLKPGDVNTIRVGATGSPDFEIFLDGLELYDD
ncbi:carbohydrate-binding module family 35 protein [Canariomyces notabilis]|uniref:Carbohydrate-binding module family 35 protein n=1 Tax=Canariomyces notabilis TaxID=2074819 RepID=A0AAN6TAG5_9PEZI|nr:carbohydrate-binding module family 35 protein [Canariomyces arenarius]